MGNREKADTEAIASASVKFTAAVVIEGCVPRKLPANGYKYSVTVTVTVGDGRKPVPVLRAQD